MANKARNKKSRRKKERDIRLSSTQMVQPGIRDLDEAQPADALSTPAPRETSLQEEYRYVIADLKRIGVIAVAMLAVLIALMLLLP